jgi:gliding motility-associated peptidyl-prolyl isomerase
MKLKGIFIACCLLFLSCAEPEARRPITVKTKTTLASTVEQTKKLNKIEEQNILQYIAQDSSRTYVNSKNGFWYTYINKVEGTQDLPKVNDQVLISYEIKDLNNVVIYSKETLGNKLYTVDKENFIAGLQIGIKMMKEGETVTFIIPSYNAYGILGDEKKIGMNQSIISTVTLLKINQNHKNEN